MATAPLVLVADDHEDSRVILRAVLEDRGSRVLEAPDGEACLDVARKERPDVVVLDLLMPRMDGWETAIALRSDPRTATVPILAYTATEIPEDHQRALDAGCKLVLVKPARPTDVADVIEALHAWHQAFLAASKETREESAFLRELAREVRSESEALRAQAADSHVESAGQRARRLGASISVNRAVLPGIDAAAASPAPPPDAPEAPF